MPEFDSSIEYRDIGEFPGHRVSSDGRVWTCWIPQVRPATMGKIWREKLIYRKKIGSNLGYSEVQFYVGRRQYHRLVHRLVLEAFVGPCPEGMECCHNDGTRDNNSLSNLRWDTRKANADDVGRHGKRMRGEKHYCAKLTNDDIRAMRLLRSYGVEYKILADKFGVCLSSCASICSRKTWKHVN